MINRERGRESEIDRRFVCRQRGIHVNRRLVLPEIRGWREDVFQRTKKEEVWGNSKSGSGRETCSG